MVSRFVVAGEGVVAHWVEVGIEFSPPPGPAGLIQTTMMHEIISAAMAASTTTSSTIIIVKISSMMTNYSGDQR